MQQNFLNDMQTVVTGQVESVTRYDIDADNRGGSIWVSKPSSGKNPNVLGRDLIKIKMPFAMFDQLRQKQESGELEFPCMMEILCDIDMGGANRAVLTAVSTKRLINEVSRPVVDKPEQKAASKPQ
ncbi:hypothetical protein [Methylomicrobium sp. Wu6]|uniref:hypothetical protein n=1 Tax=Methylomicrobium sp. Wu6 TaxID=3107928 RepID=UPI002DD668F8|nr:hypothetical protein [Methylomicrobium sp. Wu6]MEC4749810.1 hypothetical protein [Methylomicrobium sp. Wu6]